MGSTSIDYGPARDADERRAYGELAARNFAFPEAVAPEWFDRLGVDAIRFVRREGRIAGGLAVIDMGQWFGGRRVATGGVVAVAVEPELRGLGVGRALMRSALVEMRARGLALSTLYPATHAFYRDVGYELAGGRYEIRIAASAIGAHDRDAPVFRLEHGCDGAVRAAYARAAATSPGWLDRHEYIWSRIPEWRAEVREGYAVGTPRAIEGYVFLARRRNATGRHDVVVADLVALDARAGRRLLALLGDHRSLADDVVVQGGPNDPWLALLPEGARVALVLPWMIRIVDLPAALSQRGFPHAVEAELELDVRDALLPENAGRWRVRVSGGRAEVERGGRGRVALDVRGLAALYSGLRDADAVALLGLLEAGAEDRALASALFAGPMPTMPDMF